jgi:hypothetical protein
MGDVVDFSKYNGRDPVAEVPFFVDGVELGARLAHVAEHSMPITEEEATDFVAGVLVAMRDAMLSYAPPEARDLIMKFISTEPFPTDDEPASPPAA